MPEASPPSPDPHAGAPDRSPLPPDQAEARARVGGALRHLGHVLVGHHASVAELDALTDDLARQTGAIAGNELRSRVIERPTGDWGPPPSDGEAMFSYDERPFSGRSSPWGLDLDVVREGDEAVARVTLDAAHEGAPGRSHGGIVAALFDDVYGFVLTILQQPAFTGELTVRYERGVPLYTPLECRARLTGRERRKLFMTAELTGPSPDDVDSVVYGRSHAVFIAIEPETFGRGA